QSGHISESYEKLSRAGELYEVNQGRLDKYRVFGHPPLYTCFQRKIIDGSDKQPMVVNIVSPVRRGNIARSAVMTVPTPIRTAPLKAEAVPVLAVNGDIEAAVALGSMNPTKNIIETKPATVIV